MSYVTRRPGRFASLSPLAPLSLLLAGLAPTPAAAAAGTSTGIDGDHLTVTVQNAGARDGTYDIRCHPGRGSHPDPQGACAAVERNTRWGQDPFAPVPQGTLCTMQYGGPATAHVTGTWAGRPVDARFDRSGGCDIGRWDRFVPLLPAVGA
ncbi:SSI family serine proteinase inhibitor [Streptomyces sp. NPDC047072]|uniref:SSI family serine proteinase inhibitor n=1 Tax=Streptomyces sp. NPDC047072 TaxID=3154809 RepID=UPI0033FBB1C2